MYAIRSYYDHFAQVEERLRKDTASITQKMEKRGGGINTIQLKYLPEILPNYYQLDVSFETRDAMGANFINSSLEQFGKSLKLWFSEQKDWAAEERDAEIIMAILSNYVPDSRVRVWVECPVEQLAETSDVASQPKADFTVARSCRMRCTSWLIMTSLLLFPE